MLNFIDQLDEEQAANAEKVAKAAKRAGVDPALAVAIAFQESRLRSNPPRGSSGEIGMMQIMPGTGRGMGYNEKQLGNLDQNIEAGIQYLKKGLEATGNDAQLTAIYYNGGPGAVQALTQGKDPDPRVFDYLRSINSYGTFGPKPEAAPEAGAQPGAEPGAQQGAQPPGETDEQRDARIAADMQRVQEEQERRMGQIYGGGAGTAIAAGRLASTKAKDVAAALGEASETGRIAAQTRAGVPAGGLPPAGAPGAPAAPQSVIRLPGGAPGGMPGGAPGGLPGAPVGPADAGYMARGQTGAQVYNTAKSIGLTDIEAGRALDATKQEGGAHDLLKKRREATLDIRQRFPSETYVENPRYGGLLTLDQGAGGGPRASYVSQSPSPAAPGQPAQAGGLRPLPPRQPVPTTPVQPTGLQAVTQELRALARPVVAGASTVGRYVVPPLALAGAGGEAADVYSELRKEDPDYIKAGLSGLTGLSGVAALFPPLTIPATAVGGSAALINYLREQQKEKERRGIVTPPAPSIDYAAP